MSVQPSQWSPPERLDEYELVREIGRGAMGHVYLARDTLLDRLVAVKFLLRHRDPRARERLVVEARAAARVQHPNVVAIYRVGEVDERPFIVTEFVRGTPLNAIERPVPWQRALGFGIGLARGLAAAHRAGILHRDVKPGNAIVGDDDVVKLVDFGLAKLQYDGPSALASTGAVLPVATVTGDATLRPPDDSGDADAIELPTLDESPALGSRLTQTGALLGTPLYMAPEMWRGEPGTTRADVYSAGALLYELMAGAPPHAATATPALADLVMNRDAMPLRERAPDIDARVADAVDRCLRRDPGERFASGEELCAALAEIEDERRSGPVPAGNPYRGLLPYEAAHRRLFFGRGAEVRGLIERLRAQPFVLVAGDSGVGKSSVCRAGVVPAVVGGALDDRRTWRALAITPGRRPGRALAACLELESLDDVRRNVAAALGPEGGLILVVDQLEELITVSEPAEARTAAVALAELAQHTPGLRVVATVRGDYVARLGHLPGLGAELSRAFYLLRPLDLDARRDAIAGPARATGVVFEPTELVDELAAAAQGEALPVLQFALSELWEAQSEDRVIDRATLARIGGVAGALSRHADAVIAGLMPAVRDHARRILLRLVGEHHTRVARTEAELGCDRADGRAALEALVTGRLAIARDDADAPTYELAHEALITGWPTLRDWLDSAASTRAVQQRLAAAAAEWRRLDSGRHGLWNARQLAETDVLDVSALSAGDAAFLAASRGVVRRQRWTRRFAVAAVVLLVGGLYGGLRARAQWELDGRVRGHRDRAARALADVRTARAALRDERAAAYAAFDARDRERGEALWAGAVANAVEVRRAYARATEPLEAARALDPDNAAARDALADLLYERALLAEADGDWLATEELLQRMRAHDVHGERAAAWDEPGRIAITTTPAGAQVSIPGSRADTAPAALERAPGAYVIHAHLDGYAPAQYAVLVRRGEAIDIDIELVKADAVPPGYRYIPPGTFLFGSGEAEAQRLFHEAAPIHSRRTGAYAIAAHETTLGEWIEYLETLSDAERAERAPRGSVSLARTAEGTWRLGLEPEPSQTRYDVVSTEPLRFPGRDRRAEQRWLRMPVVGIRSEDARAYAQWLRETGRVPGARLCREDEWERAARGADDRRFPHGDALAPDDANIDITYGRRAGAYGPDEVGSHPASVSPYGVHDMAGNVFEFVDSVLDDQHLARGGAFFYTEGSAAVTNREFLPAETAAPTIGFRLCADIAR